MTVNAGLDFGNRNCVLSVPATNGVDIVLSPSSNRLIPSMVTYAGDRRYAGEFSQQMQMQFTKETITDIKRLVQLPYDSKERENLSKHVSFPLVELPGGLTGVQVMFRDRELTLKPEQLIAYLLKDLAKIVKMQKGEVENFFIVVSPWWTENHRRTILNAADIAGIKDVELVNSTTAAAVAYTMIHGDRLPENDENPVHVAFVDLGDSSMNVAVAEVKQGFVKILSVASDSHLGGSYFTEPLESYLLNKVIEKYNIDPRTSPRAMIRFNAAVDKLKKTLSINPVVQFEISSLMEDKDVSFLVKRDEFNDQITELVERIEEPIQKALEFAGIEKEDLFAVEILGGGSRVPLVRSKIEEILGKQPLMSLNLDESFAIGAGYIASASPFLTIIDNTVHQVTAQLSEDESAEIFKQFDEIPFEAEFSIPVSGEKTVQIRNSDEEIGRLTVRTNSEAVNEISFNAKINKNGIFDIVDARCDNEDVEVEFEYSPLAHMKKEDLDDFVTLEAEMENNDDNETKIDEAKNKLESYIFFAESMVKRDSTDFFDPERHDEFCNKIESVHNWFTENEFERFPIDDYLAQLEELKEIIEPVVTLKQKNTEKIESLHRLKSDASSLIQTVEADKERLSLAESVALRSELPIFIQQIDEALETPKHKEIDYDTEVAQKILLSYQQRANKLKSTPLPKKKQIPKRRNDPWAMFNDFDEDEYQQRRIEEAQRLQKERLAKQKQLQEERLANQKRIQEERIAKQKQMQEEKQKRIEEVRRQKEEEKLAKIKEEEERVKHLEEEIEEDQRKQKLYDDPWGRSSFWEDPWNTPRRASPDMRREAENERLRRLEAERIRQAQIEEQKRRAQKAQEQRRRANQYYGSSWDDPWGTQRQPQMRRRPNYGYGNPFFF